MDLGTLRDLAIEETAQFFMKTIGYVPEEDSDEWEKEYPRHFEKVKREYGDKPATARPEAPVRAADQPTALPDLAGLPAEKRWAAELRAERLKEIADKDLRSWLVSAWTSSKIWIDTRATPLPALLRRLEAERADHRRKAEAEAAQLQGELQAKMDAAAALQRQIAAAGITLEGLIELLDICNRAPAVPVRAKLVELGAGNRTLRVFETGSPALLMVLEKNKEGKSDYAIERDEGLVADLKLFAQGLAAQAELAPQK